MNGTSKTAKAEQQTKVIESPGINLKIISLISMIIFFALWESVVRMGFIEPLFLPAPSAIVRRASIMLERNDFSVHILASARRVLVGFGLAALVAIPAGIILGTSRLAKAIFDPLLSFLRPLPSMSWIPLSLLWLGITEWQKYSIVFMGSLAPSILYTVEATRNIDPVLIRAAKNLGASKLQVMKDVVLPGALPSIIAGLKVMMGIAWTCVISAELVAASNGLGFLIMNGKEMFQTDTVLLGMALISITVLITDMVLNRVEKILLPWRDG